MKKILMTFLICFSFLMIFTGCVSTNKEPPMFVDWEGKATGSKYPAWLEDIMLEKGFMSAPMLEVDGNVMDFKEGNIWINTYGK